MVIVSVEVQQIVKKKGETAELVLAVRREGAHWTQPIHWLGVLQVIWIPMAYADLPLAVQQRERREEAAGKDAKR